MTHEQSQALHNAGKIIGQYQKFHYELKDACAKSLAVNSKIPDRVITYQIDKDDYEMFQKLKSMIHNFEINYNG